MALPVMWAFFYVVHAAPCRAESVSRVHSGDVPLVLFKSCQPLRGFVEKRDSLVVRKITGYPDDPPSDIPWSGGTSGVVDIQSAYNNARAVENAQMGTAVPMLMLPPQTEWDGMSDGQRALWLINRERTDRGVHALHGLEANVTGVAQDYAQYLIDHDAFGHYADGRTPWERLNANPAIGACHDPLSVAENLAVFWASGATIPLPVERAIFMWMYGDAGSSWGHRHAVLWFPYEENGGEAAAEGFLGIGRAGGPHQGWEYGEMIVMNVFDPCANWDYGARVSLEMAILGLKVLSGAPLPGVLPGTLDVTGDERIDLTDVICALQIVARVRP